MVSDKCIYDLISFTIILQILTFENLFLFETLSEEVTEMLLSTMSDMQMEVIIVELCIFLQ